MDEACQRPQARLALVAPWIAANNTFASTIRDTTGGALIGHAARQPQHILDSIRLALIRPHAYSPGSRAKRGIMDGDDGAQSQRFFLAEEEVFVIIRGHAVKNKALHRGGFPFGYLYL